MEYPKNAGSMIKKQYIKPTTKKISSLTVLFTILFLAVGLVQAQTEWPKIVNSKDGTPISYEIYGTGEPTLVFVR